MKPLKNAITSMVITALALAAAAVYFLPEAGVIGLRKSLSALPLDIGGWAGRQKAASDFLVATLGADDVLLREYQGPGGGSAELYASYFTYTKEKKTPHAPQLCWVGSGWALRDLGEETLPLDCAGCPSAKVRTVLAEKAGNVVVLVYTYKINERYVTDLLTFRVINLIDTILRRRNSAFTAQLSARVTGDSLEKTAAEMKTLMAKILSTAEKDLLP